MKKIALFVLLALMLSGCAASVTQLQQLPDEGVDLVFVVVTTAALWVLLKLKDYFGIDLSGYANAIAAALAPLVVTFIEQYLQLIPPVFDGIVVAIIHYLFLLVGSLGVFWIAKRKPAPSLQ